ncbi:DNA glycosylase AlkZ-like family protein [Streptomyces nigrescens]
MSHSRPHIDTAGRRARLGRRQLLAGGHRADRVEEVAEAVVGLHASDPATVHLAACARLAEPDPAEVERALYDDGSLVRMLGMRRTLFAVGAGLVPVVASSTARAVAAKERAGLVRWLTEGAPGWDERRLDQQFLPLDARHRVRRTARATGTRGARRTRPPPARLVRPGDRRGPQVVDGLDAHRHPAGAGRHRRRRSDPGRRHHGRRAARRRRQRGRRGGGGRGGPAGGLGR